MKKLLRKQKTKVFMYEIWNPLPVFTHFIDISDSLEHKKNLIKQYKSQNEIQGYSSGIIGLNKYRAMQLDITGAEVFLSWN